MECVRCGCSTSNWVTLADEAGAWTMWPICVDCAVLLKEAVDKLIEKARGKRGLDAGLG